MGYCSDYVATAHRSGVFVVAALCLLRLGSWYGHWHFCHPWELIIGDFSSDCSHLGTNDT